MRNVIYAVATILSIMAIGYLSSRAVEKAYEDYIRTSEELLWMLEEICEQNGMPWGDTVCETDVWADYTEARHTLGLGDLPYYGDLNNM